MRTHPTYTADGTRLAGILTNVYLTRLDVEDLATLLTLNARFRKYGERFGAWLGDELLFEIDRRGTSTEPAALVLPLDWAHCRYADAAAVLVFIMRVLGPRPYLLQLAYAVAEWIASRPRDAGPVVVLE